MRLDECFERVYLLNLPFKKDRRSRVVRHLRENGIVDTRRLIWQRAICGDWTPPPDWWGAGNGAWGCLMSHLRLGQDAVHDKLASYCVLEDDVVFHPCAPQMLEGLMRELPSDWGQLYLGGQFLHREPEEINSVVVRPYNVNRTHAFALNANAIPRFLQHIMHAPDYFDIRVDNGDTKFDQNCFHIDHQLGRAHERRDWNTYAPVWWLAGQEAGSSNISGRDNPRMWWHWRSRGTMLPFFFLKPNAKPSQRKKGARYLHPGYNLVEDSLTDIGITKRLDDDALSRWLHLIAGEAVERWLLPGFEVPPAQPDLPERVQRLWDAGILKFEPQIAGTAINYPFNGLCGGS
jgi:hypothetical protein